MTLKILGRIPFAFATMDRGVVGEGEKGKEEKGQGLVDTMLSQAQLRLADSGKTREAAAELIARILTRPDLVFKSFYNSMREYI